MVKEKRILSYFTGWLIFGFLVCFIGISNIFALETNFESLSVQGYNNNGTSLTNPNVFNCSAGSCGMEITTNVNSYGGAWAIQSPIPLLKNHTYTLSLRIRNTAGVGITLSSKNRIAIGNSIASVKHNYETGDYWNTLKTSVASGNYTLQFVFTPTGPASYLLVPFTTSSTITTSFMIDNIIIEDLGSEGISQDEINNSLNSQTNTLNQSIQNSTDTITGSITDSENNINQNIDDMESAIVDSNKETQNVIKDQFNTCRDSINLINIEQISLNMSNRLYEYTIPITLPSGTYTLSYNFLTNNSLSKRFQVWLSSDNNTIKYFNLSDSGYITFTINSSFDKLMFFISSSADSNSNFSINKIQLQKGSVATEYEPYGEQVCTNKIDETNNQLGNLNDNLNNSNSSGATNSAGDFFSGFTTDTFGLTSIITAPLNLIGSITSSACSPLGLPLPYVNKTLELPCMTSIYSEYFGSFFTMYQSITFGIISYWVCIRIFNLVKDFKNPDHDEIEVLDL